MRFVQRRILSGNINQNTLTIAILLKSNTLLEEDRFADTDNITRKKISTHSRCLSKYIICCLDRRVLRILAWTFTPYSTPLGVKNSSFNHSAAGPIRIILSFKSILS
jgi:hypothetical protein